MSEDNGNAVATEAESTSVEGETVAESSEVQETESKSLIDQAVDAAEEAGDQEPEEQAEDQKPVEDKVSEITYDGITIPEDIQDAAEGILAAAKEHKVSKDGLQSVVDEVAKVYANREESATAEDAKKVQQWEADFNALPNAKELLTDAGFAVKYLLSPQDRQELSDHPVLGKHPTLIRMLAIAGASHAEGKFRGGSSANAEPAPAHKRIYTSHQ